MTSLTLYGANAAAATVATADKLATTTGGTETHNTSTAPGSGTNLYLEILSQGGTPSTGASLPAPSGKGWLLDATTLEGQTILAGNWSATIGMSDTTGPFPIKFTIRFYKRSSGGTYTSIGSIVSSATSIATSRTAVSFSATSMAATSFATGDKLYIDLFANDNGGGWASDGLGCYVSNSGTQGVANDLQITTPGYATNVFKDVTVRGKVSAQVHKDVTVRGKVSAQVHKDVTVRGKVAAGTAFKDISVRGKVSIRYLSGGFGLWANGTGTASFDHFRCTQYPDPALSLAPVLPRDGSTLVDFEVVTPNGNTSALIDVSTDGVTFTNVPTSGATIPTITSQPTPTVDTFSSDSHTGYTSTFLGQ